MGWWTNLRDDVRGAVTGSHPDDERNIRRQQEEMEKSRRQMAAESARLDAEKLTNKKLAADKAIRSQRRAFRKPGFQDDYSDKLGK